MIRLAEHTFEDRLRVRVVGIEGLFIAVAGAELGGLDTGRDAVWRWLSFERLVPPFQEQLNDIRRDVASDDGRIMFRRLVAGWGIPWREVSLDTAIWQVRKMERLPRWIKDRVTDPPGVAGALVEDRLDLLRRALLDEDVTEMQRALASCRVYEERALDRLAVPRG